MKSTDAVFCLWSICRAGIVRRMPFSGAASRLFVFALRAKTPPYFLFIISYLPQFLPSYHRVRFQNRIVLLFILRGGLIVQHVDRYRDYRACN